MELQLEHYKYLNGTKFKEKDRLKMLPWLTD